MPPTPVDHATLTAYELHVPFHFVQPTDPGAVGAGLTWLDTSGTPYVLNVRDSGNANWIQVGAGLVNPMSLLGDTIYGGASGVPTRLTGNVTSARQFLLSQGALGVPTAPAWTALQAGDYPDFVAAGASHADGGVPDPGGTGHTPAYYLGDDAAWHQLEGGVAYTWPGSNAAGVLTNDGSGNLTWASGGGGSSAGNAGDIQLSDGSGGFTTPSASEFNYVTGGTFTINSVTQNWPGANAAGVLINDGSGDLTWGTVPNSDLTHSSLTVTAGTGMSGGGTVSLGGSVTLTNAGVTSLSGTTHQVICSSSTGSVTLSLPQSIDTSSSPTFAGETLTSTLVVSFAPSGVDLADFTASSNDGYVRITAPSGNVAALAFNAASSTEFLLYRPASSNDFRVYSFGIGSDTLALLPGGSLLAPAGPVVAMGSAGVSWASYGSGVGTFLDWQSTYGRLAAYDFVHSVYKPIQVGAGANVVVGPGSDDGVHLLQVQGQISVVTAGKGLSIKTGSNCKMGTGTLAAGTATISTTAVTASSYILLTPTSTDVNAGVLSVGTITAGTSFVVNSSNVRDDNTFNWLIIEPA